MHPPASQVCDTIKPSLSRENSSEPSQTRRETRVVAYFVWLYEGRHVVFGVARAQTCLLLAHSITPTLLVFWTPRLNTTAFGAVFVL